MTLHEMAEKGFQSADAYERGRPSYAAEAVDYVVRTLGISADSTVVDVAAGTGKFTRLLKPTGATLIGIEPSARMREVCEKYARCLDGTAEAMPLPSSSADAIVVAQAFHWFDGPAALREFHRVLRPGGGLALIWNAADESVPWMKELARVTVPYETGTPRFRSTQWRRAFDETTLFSELKETTYSHVFVGPPSSAIDRIVSISFIAALPEAERAKVADRVRQVLGPERLASAQIEMPYRTHVFSCARQ